MTEKPGLTLVATYDFLWGHGNNMEIVRKGDPIPFSGTSQMTAGEHRRSLIRQGAGKEVDLTT